jgi:SAM-dependent methyltransferase
MGFEIAEKLQALRISFGYFGVKGTAAVMLNKFLQTFKINAYNERYKKNIDRAFDSRFDVDTGGIIEQDQLDISEDRKKLAIQYQGTPTVNLGLALSKLSINYPDFLFIDIGAGKGRAIFMAARYSFKGIIGVELSEDLHKICEKNITSLKKGKLKCLNIKAVHQDAATFQFPNEPLVLYFFHPFNEEMFQEVLKNIGQSLERNNRQIIIMYYHPGFNNLIGEPEFLDKIDLGVADSYWEFYRSKTV